MVSISLENTSVRGILSCEASAAGRSFKSVVGENLTGVLLISEGGKAMVPPAKNPPSGHEDSPGNSESSHRVSPVKNGLTSRSFERVPLTKRSANASILG